MKHLEKNKTQSFHFSYPSFTTPSNNANHVDWRTCVWVNKRGNVILCQHVLSWNSMRSDKKLLFGFIIRFPPSITSCRVEKFPLISPSSVAQTMCTYSKPSCSKYLPNCTWQKTDHTNMKLPVGSESKLKGRTFEASERDENRSQSFRKHQSNQQFD